MITVRVVPVRSAGWEPCDHCGGRFEVGNHAIEIEHGPLDMWTLHVPCAAQMAREIETRAGVL